MLVDRATDLQCSDTLLHTAAFPLQWTFGEVNKHCCRCCCCCCVATVRRPCHAVQLRLLELSKLGFSAAVVPAAGSLDLSAGELGGMAVSRQHSLGGALQELFGEDTLRRAGWYRKPRQQEGQGAREARGDRSGGRSRRQSRTTTSSSSSSADAGGDQDKQQRRFRGSRRR
jgi:hypothetical protein